jgi:Heterokaryon incompatibility protein (HET)
MATFASSKDPHGSKQKYQYRPIESPDQIRMLELLPGQDDDSIQIRLRHYSLSFLPQCEALSYEWGSPTRDYEIDCEGMSLKVTTNLLAALKRLRPTKSFSGALKKGRLPWKSRLLWIDALCINQDDISERSQQVKLMGEVYRKAKRVLVWIGEAPPLARKAFYLIPRLAKIIECLNLDAYDYPQPLEGTLEIRRDFTLEQLLDEAVWPALQDILGSRTYFSRLW